MKAVGTQPGARECAPDEPPHPPQGRSHRTPLSLLRPWQWRSPKEPVCTPDPETQASSSWNPGVHPQYPRDPRVPPSCISWSPPDPPGCPLRVHVLSLINVHSVFSSRSVLCVVVCGHPKMGWKAEVAVLIPPPPPPPGPPSLATSFLAHLPEGSPRLCALVPICAPQTLKGPGHRPPPLQLPGLPVGPGTGRGND